MNNYLIDLVKLKNKNKRTKYIIANNIKSKKIVKKKFKSFKVGGFYYKFLYGDIIISTFINFLVKNGYKNKAIRFFFKALSTLKSKFGINPVLLIKYIILKRNVLHKVTTKRVKKKTFFYLRLLDFDRQIKNTVRKIMKLILFLKEKKQLKLWQCIFLVLLNFCLFTNEHKSNITNFSLAVNEDKFKSFINFYSFYRKSYTFFKLYKSVYIQLKKIVFFLSNIMKTLPLFINYVHMNSFNTLSSMYLYILHYYKVVYKLLYLIKYKQLILTNFYSPKLIKIKEKLFKYFKRFFKYTKKYSKRKTLKDKKIKETFLNYFFFKELAEFKKASEFKNSFLNFKLSNKKKRELSMGTRIHTKYDVQLRHRKIFFRVSKYGQLKK